MTIPAKQKRAVPWHGYEQHADLADDDLLLAYDPNRGQFINIPGAVVKTLIADFDGGNALTVFDPVADSDFDGGGA
jgi:hypothetical protein